MYAAPSMPGLVDTPTGTLRLAQVMAIATRAEILDMPRIQETLAESGIRDSEIGDGNVAAGRVQCCGGPNEKSNSVLFYVPSDLHVEIGDIVEIKMGRAPNENGAGILNTVTRIRTKASDHGGQCRWDPPTEGLCMRTLYCEWMPAEGWVERRALIGERTWLKLP
jgi:hypothetical protein